MSSDKSELEALHAQLVELQTQLSFQDDAISQLNQALASQQQDIAELKRSRDLMRERYQALQTQLEQGDSADAPPPHY